MSALLPRNDRWPAFSAIARWWRRWTGVKSNSIKLEPLGPDQVKRLAQDLDLSIPDLLSLSSRGLYGSNLLERRMAVLNLDPGELARSEPALLRDLQRLCTTCPSPRRCARDLAQELARNPAEPASRDWREYCPNATTLYMLSTLKSCSDARG